MGTSQALEGDIEGAYDLGASQKEGIESIFLLACCMNWGRAAATPCFHFLSLGKRWKCYEGLCLESERSSLNRSWLSIVRFGGLSSLTLQNGDRASGHRGQGFSDPVIKQQVQ